MNVYVVSDPTNPENNGKVKIIRFGKQLYNIINNAISGEDADEFGAKVFDLSSAGVNLKVKVEDQGGYANYTASRFTSPIDLKLSENQIEEIYNSTKELDKVFNVRSYDDIKKILDEHYYCSSATPAAPLARAAVASEQSTHAKQFGESADAVGVESIDDEDDDEKMRKLIEELSA